jgi:hypothetical protein
MAVGTDRDGETTYALSTKRRRVALRHFDTDWKSKHVCSPDLYNVYCRFYCKDK